MEKILINFTSRFLIMNRLLLFLLIAFPLSLRFYSPSTDDLVWVNRLLSSIGGVCLLCWIYAIGHRANQKLVMQGIILNSFRYFNWAVLSVVITFIFFLFFSNSVSTTDSSTHFQFSKPMFLTFIFLLSFLITILVAAKALVSAELKKNAAIGEYFTTVLLIMFAAIGLWFIQPRIQNI